MTHTMGYFANAEEVYTYIGGVFREAADHETQGPKMAAAGITMALHYTDPECDLTVRFHEPRLEIVEGADDGPADKVIGAMTRAVPMKRLGEPEEVAAAVAFLASEQAGFITGQTLSVSGGLTMV